MQKFDVALDPFTFRFNVEDMKPNTLYVNNRVYITEQFAI